MENDKYDRQPWIVFRDGNELLRANAKSDLRKLAFDGKVRRDDLVRHKNLPDDSVMAGSDEAIFPYEEPSPEANIDTTPNPLLEAFRGEFEQAIKGIDNDAKKLVEAGRDFRAIEVVRDHLARIQALWELLSSLYVEFEEMSSVLGRLGSERLRRVAQKLPITQKLPKICHSYEEYAQDAFNVEQRVLHSFERMNIPTKEHWFVRPVIMTEFDFLLDILSVVIEPDFVPFEYGQRSEESQDRYIAAEVKRAVWRRDSGKCVECGSREKLEADCRAHCFGVFGEAVTSRRVIPNSGIDSSW